MDKILSNSFQSLKQLNTDLDTDFLNFSKKENSNQKSLKNLIQECEKEQDYLALKIYSEK